MCQSSRLATVLVHAIALDMTLLEMTTVSDSCAPCTSLHRSTILEAWGGGHVVALHIAHGRALPQAGAARDLEIRDLHSHSISHTN